MEYYNSLNLYTELKIKTPYHKWIKRIIAKFDSTKYYFTEIESPKDHKTKMKLYFIHEDIYNLAQATKLFKKPKSTATTLYILKHKGINNFYKIGVTSNMERRIQQLNIASPLGIEVIKTFNLGDNALNMEHLIHTENKMNRLNGEWFNLTDQQVNDLIVHIIATELSNAA